MCDFAAEVLHHPMDPWQRWLLIHAMEFQPDGFLPRFRTVLVLVSRQNGKTETPVVLSAYWMFVAEVPLILGTSTTVAYAKESWTKAVRLVERAPDLADKHPKRWTRQANGEQESWTHGEESRYKIAASNAEGGRSLTIHRLIMDELRQHHDRSAWGAAVPATNAVPDAQIWCLSNAGDDRSVVLNEEREAALDFIKTGEGDPSTGLFEWSAPEDADPMDLHALAQANPNLNRRIRADVLLNDARKAIAAGGEALATFKTENMCIRVKLLNPAIDPGAWMRCEDFGSDLSRIERRVLCVDIAPDIKHATICAAGMLPDGRVRVVVVEEWEGIGCTDRLRAALPDVIARTKAKRVGYFPSGPAAVLAASLADRRKAGRYGWPPPGVEVDEIRGEMTAACMGFVDAVSNETITHHGHPVLNEQVQGAEKLKRGDGFVFVRGTDTYVDAVYAAAGAVHMARTLPTGLGKVRILKPTGSVDTE